MNDKAPRAGLLQVFRAVFWSFLGIRRRAALESDASRLTPAQVIAGGLVAAIVFILCLVGIVHLVIKLAG